ncbi:competence protein CoiA family protein [Kiritimatiellota bacterium B12222]|nr:competence protein CoiA family protein [Kiritimatiellota bacterium B12222]
MFTAKIKRDAGMVNILDAKWQQQGELLRGLTQRGELVCPHCGQDINLRDGDVRRRHFAHRTLADCPFKEPSAEVLDIKTTLYQWLESKMPGNVQMDCRLEMPGKEVYWDFLVESENGKRFGYWIVDRQVRDRTERFDAAEKQGILPVILHTASVLKFHTDDILELTASQRAFRKRSIYDVVLQGKSGGHLQFLTGHKDLKIFRGLSLLHKPNLYEWDVLRSGGLDDAFFDDATGELFFKEDQDAERVFEEQQKQRGKKREEDKKASVQRSAPVASGMSYRTSTLQFKESVVRESSGNVQNRFNQPVECEDCGQMTCDLVKWIPKTGKCVCRACNKIRLSKA